MLPTRFSSPCAALAATTAAARSFDLSGRPTYEMRPGKGRRRDSYIWYNNGWHVGGKAELGRLALGVAEQQLLQGRARPLSHIQSSTPMATHQRPRGRAGAGLRRR